MLGLRGARRRAVLGAMLLLGAPAVGAGAVEILLRPGVEQGSHDVEGRFDAPVDPETAWAVLSDYEGIPRFVSSMKRSVVLRKDEHGALLEQEGAARFLFVSRRVKLLLSVTERRPEYIGFTDVDGSQFQRYDGSWRIERTASGCVVRYSLTAQPASALAPEFAAAIVLKSGAKRLLNEVREEMLRRARRGGKR